MIEVEQPESLQSSIEQCLKISRTLQQLHGLDHIDAMLCVLVHLATSGLTPIYASELGRRLGLPQQTTGHRVRHLHEKGFLASDRRGRVRPLRPGPSLALRSARPPAPAPVRTRTPRATVAN